VQEASQGQCECAKALLLWCPELLSYGVCQPYHVCLRLVHLPALHAIHFLLGVAACALVLCSCSYLTFAIGVAAEVVALLVVGPTVDRVGRHIIVALGQLLGGAACVACAMVSGGTTQAVLAGVGKFGCSGGLALSLPAQITLQAEAELRLLWWQHSIHSALHANRRDVGLIRQVYLLCCLLTRSCGVCDLPLHRGAAAHILPLFSDGHLQPGIPAGLHLCTLPAHAGSADGLCGRIQSGEFPQGVLTLADMHTGSIQAACASSLHVHVHTGSIMSDCATAGCAMPLLLCTGVHPLPRLWVSGAAGRSVDASDARDAGRSHARACRRKLATQQSVDALARAAESAPRHCHCHCAAQLCL
jgi:hypothetical protein